ncbi:Transposon Tf2-6 polyprotein [Cucumis melo var. makuwa]|uniref:Transposon Tf2-6 polyprotein n=1 Tax=Cucumis melo var. makuwa TaxID=1194695 RepID=A0A5D3C1B9_CUCMM|nr:Transposon Tf2-6 polyprotein [Cucumis melo var. makuwa]
MPFGLTNAPSTFQALMNVVFRTYMRRFVLVFFDDILVYNKELEEHIQHLELMLEILRANELYANLGKCNFAKKRVNYLGHVISEKGVEVDLEKIRAISEWPIPTNVREVRGFLGLTRYYCRFEHNYGSIAGPLTQLLKNGSFMWNEEATASFKQLKKAMMTLPVLAMPDFNLLFEIEINASGYEVRAVLTQAKRPIAYFSRTLSIRDKAKSVYERKLIAVVFAVQRRRPYLLGRKFVVKTDQRSLKFLLEQHGLSKSAGFEAIFVVVDRMSKYAHFMALKHPYTTKSVAELFVKEVVRDCPLICMGESGQITDSICLSFWDKTEWEAGNIITQDEIHSFPPVGVFVSNFWNELFKLADTKLHRSSAYHLQTDGQTEVVNRGLEAYLRCFCGERPKEWTNWLHSVEYWYNTTYNSSIDITPLQAVYGRLPPPLLYYRDVATLNSTLDQQLKDRDIALGTLKEHLRIAQEKIKKHADLRRKVVEF